MVFHRQQAELVALGIGEDEPRLLPRLPDLCPRRAMVIRRNDRKVRFAY